MSSIYDWSVVAANNSNSDAAITWSEGQAPSTVNNSARQLEARVREFITDIAGSIAAGGTANGLTITAASPFTAYADGMIISFRATASNTAAATLSVNGIGAKAIRKMGTTADIAIEAGDIVNTGIYVALYSAALNGAAGAWLLINATRAGKAPTVQLFAISGTWTKPFGCRYAIFEGQGAGAGSGGVDGQGGGTAGATGGGGSGFYGMTGMIDVSATASAAVTIGAAGAPGAAGVNAGGNGGDTAITIAAITYTWGGGIGSNGYLANASPSGAGLGGKGGTGTNVVGHSTNGSMGSSQADAAAGRGTGGDGGSSGLGRGGQGAHSIAVSAGISGEDGQAKGTGGGGSMVNNAVSNFAGAAGSIGYMRVWEYY